MIKEFFRKAQFLVLMALGTYPICACVLVFVAPELLPYLWLLPLCYGVLGMLSFALPGKLRLPLGILGAVLFLVPCVLWLEGNARNMMLTFSFGYGALLLWSVRIPGWEPDQEIPAGWLGGGLAILLFGCLLSFYEPRLDSVAAGIRVSLFVFVFLAMLSLNRSSLILAAGGRRGFSTAMRHKNVLLTVGMFAIAVAVALIPSVFQLIQQLVHWIGQAFLWLQQQLPEETIAETTTIATTVESSTGEGMEVLFEGLETHRTSQATYFMMAVIALAFIVPVGCYSLYKLFTAIYALIKRVVADIAVNATTQTEEFQDEITDTRDDAESEHYRGDREKKVPGPNLGKMTPADQIRYRYRRLSAKHPEWKEHRTARENLPEAAAQLYERARYSDHPITEQDAENFKNKTK